MMESSQTEPEETKTNPNKDADLPDATQHASYDCDYFGFGDDENFGTDAMKRESGGEASTNDSSSGTNMHKREEDIIKFLRVDQGHSNPFTFFFQVKTCIKNSDFKLRYNPRNI